MRVARLEFSTTDIKIDTEITKPQMDIKQRNAELTIEQPAAIIEMKTTPSKLEIDQSQAFADAGIYSTGEMIKRYAQKGKQQVLKYITKTVQEGEQIRLSAGKGNMRKTLQDVFSADIKPKVAKSTIKFIPSYGSVKFHYTPKKLDINITPQKPKVHVETHEPEYNFNPGSITRNVIAWPTINYEVRK